MKPSPIKECVITGHAAFELRRRGIREETVRKVLAGPEQQLEDRPGRIILQSRVSLGAPPKVYLVRVFVDVDRRPAEVVTAYYTSKVSKYWKEGA